MPPRFSKQGTVFRAETRITPDQLTRIAESVGASVPGATSPTLIRLDHAEDGQLSFSVRSRWVDLELMVFGVHIAADDDGVTRVDTHIHRCRALPTHKLLGYPSFKRYTRELANALQRFDPASTALLLEQPRPRQPTSADRS